MNRVKWIIYIIKDFVGMLCLWQLDHTYSHLVWDYNESVEILRFFTIPVYMMLTDFWVLCFFVLLLALYIPEIYEVTKWLWNKTK